LLAFISENDIEIKQVKIKEKMVVNALIQAILIVHLLVISTCEYDLKSRIKEALNKNVYFLQIIKGFFGKSH